MKIALINPPFRGRLSFSKPSFPLGLGYLKAMCKLNDLSCTALTDDEICLKYNFSKYDYIGFMTFTPSFRDTIELIKKVKTDKNIIVVGGYHATLLGGKILEDFHFIDYSLIG